MDLPLDRTRDEQRLLVALYRIALGDTSTPVRYCELAAEVRRVALLDMNDEQFAAYAAESRDLVMRARVSGIRSPGEAHAMCDVCWRERWPDERDPIRVHDPVTKERRTERCCFCGVATRSGVYIFDTSERATHCKGHPK